MQLRAILLRRWLLPALLGAAGSVFAQPAPTSPAVVPDGVRVLRIGHQFPGSTGAEGDFRDRLCRLFAEELAKRTNGALRGEVFPANKLVKPEGQLEALSNGTMDVALMPLNNTFAKLPELNVTLLPGVIRSYEQALRWKTAPIGKEISEPLEKNGVLILTWIWQGAGIVALERPVLLPEQIRGLRVRGLGRATDIMLGAAGAQMQAMPSSEIAKAFRERKLDVALTSSTSLVAFKLQDFCRAVTTPRILSLFFIPEPFVISKSVFLSLTPAQQKIVREIGDSFEKVALDFARADDQKLAEVYLATNALVADMDEEQWLRWQMIAKAVAWRDYEKQIPRGAEILKKALEVP